MPDTAEFAEAPQPSPEEAPELSGKDRRRKRMAAWARYVIGLGLGAAALWAVSGQRGELVGASNELSRVNPSWVLAAAVSEIVSFLAFARMQQRLLRAADVRISNGRVLSLTVAASAIASSIPGGPAFATVYAYRQYRRAGADEPIAGWGLIATLLCSALGLTLVAAAGVLLAEREGAALDLVGVTGAILLVVIVAAVIFSRRQIVASVALFSLRVVKRLIGLPRGDAEEHLNRVAQQLSQVRLTVRDIVPALGWSLGNWVFDCGALALSYTAIGAGVPWRGLLLAYGAAQLASNLPITPGGLGVVEGSLTIALVAYGGVQVSTVAAVILYRIISFWGFLPVGWVVWAVTAVRDRRHDRVRATARLLRRSDPLAVAVAAAERTQP
ncbi:MAG: lysylphosphatidylglycerol synthase transmembrane domain-containing protein [Acidimicrobiales bacterium]